MTRCHQAIPAVAATGRSRFAPGGVALGVREELLSVVPDGPLTLEIRALLLEDETAFVGTAAGALVLGERHRLAALVGAWGTALADRAEVLLSRGWSILALDAGGTPSLPWKPATIHTLADPSRIRAVLAGGGPRPSLLASSESGAVPAALRGEITGAITRGPVAVLRVAGAIVSVAYAPLRTETLFDVSVDTVEAHRGRGFGRRAAALLIEEESRSGRVPVWGALDGNLPSRAVGAALGFAPVGRLLVAEV